MHTAKFQHLINRLLLETFLL